MSYQNVNTCRFYVDLVSYLKASGLPFDDIYNKVGINPANIRTVQVGEDTPINLIRYGNSNNAFPVIPKNIPIRFIAVLGHNFHYRYLNPHFHIGLGEGYSYGYMEYSNIINWGAGTDYFTPTYDGFSIAKVTNMANGAIDDISRISLYQEQNDAEGQPNTAFEYKVGSFLIGDYYDMPVNPNLSLKMSREYGGIDELVSYNGSSFTNQAWLKPPDWGDGGAWEVYKNTTTGDSAWTHNNSALSRSGRKSWDLSFSYLDDANLFGSNQLLLNYNSDSVDY